MCPSLVGVHLGAYLCARSSSQTAKEIPESYKCTVSNAFCYFTNSSLWCNKIHKVQNFLSFPELKYAKLHSVRWLSIEKAVSVI